MTSCHDKEIRSLTPSGINVNNMAWLAVDKDGTEKIFSVKPFRGNTQEDESHVWGTYVPVGTISKLIGRELSWNNEPVELKEE